MLYIYALAHPDDGLAFYVGATRRHPNERLKEHVSLALKGDSTHRSHRILLLLAQGKMPTVRVLRRFRRRLTDEELSREEDACIEMLRQEGAPLANYRDARPLPDKRTIAFYASAELADRLRTFVGSRNVSRLLRQLVTRYLEENGG